MYKSIIKEIPGFRTGSKWKKIFAIIMYLFAIGIIINVSGVTLRDKFINELQTLIMFGIPFVLITNIGNIRGKLPVFNKKTIKFNILGGFIALIIIAIGISTLNSLKSPQQKQLDLIAQRQSKSKKVASDLDSKIKKLGDANNLTLDKASDVKATRAAYEALTSEEKGFVTKLEALVLAEKKIVDLQVTADKESATKKAAATKAAAEVDSKITALGDINILTLDKAAAVKSTRTAYEALTPYAKGIVTKLTILVSAEKKITTLQAEAEKKAAAAKVAAEKAAAQKKAAVAKAAAEKAAAEKRAAAAKAAADKAAAQKKAAAAKAAADYKAWVNSQFSAWNGSHIALARLVKENLNDPKSFDHVKTVYWDKGDYLIVKMTYRAKNGFGALILQNVTAKASYKSNSIVITSQND